MVTATCLLLHPLVKDDMTTSSRLRPRLRFTSRIKYLIFPKQEQAKNFCPQGRIFPCGHNRIKQVPIKLSLWVWSKGTSWSPGKQGALCSTDLAQIPTLVSFREVDEGRCQRDRLWQTQVPQICCLNTQVFRCLCSLCIVISHYKLCGFKQHILIVAWLLKVRGWAYQD